LNETAQDGIRLSRIEDEEKSTMTGPLEGFRIVDVTQMISGPVATMMLGDQGADVIKVEPVSTGDLTRATGSRRRAIAPMFASSNRSKRSLALDLKTQAGIDLLKRLVATADVFVQNFRPGTVERMGIGEDALRQVRRDLIYVSISGFGETGPYVLKRVYDPVIQALSGLAAIQSDIATKRPQMIRLIVPDLVSALTVSQAVTAALLARHRNGERQHVKVAMLDAVVAFLWPEGMAGLTLIDSSAGAGRPPSRDLIFETTDGYITAGAVSNKEWQALAEALGHPEWIEDPRFATPASRVHNIDVRLELTAEVLKTQSSAHWLSRLDAAQVPCAPVLSLDEVISDPQVKANELIVEFDHPHGGRMRQPRPAARFSNTPAEIRRPAPLLGEHSDEVLREIGLSNTELAALRSSGTIA